MNSPQNKKKDPPRFFLLPPPPPSSDKGMMYIYPAEAVAATIHHALLFVLDLKTDFSARSLAFQDQERDVFKMIEPFRHPANYYLHHYLVVIHCIRTIIQHTHTHIGATGAFVIRSVIHRTAEHLFCDLFRPIRFPVPSATHIVHELR